MRESKKAKEARVARIIEKLHEEYGSEPRIFLNFEKPWQLLVAVILSAPCTDERVNIVTKDLFRKYTTVESLSKADLSELERDINSIGLYKAKSKNLIACAKALIENFDSKVPSDIEELTSLAGVGRKTANVIRGNIYNIPSIVVDTHVKRVSKRLGLVKSDEPEKVEYELMKVLPKEEWILWNINIISLGRAICKARNPMCKSCFLSSDCPSAGKLGQGA